MHSICQATWLISNNNIVHTQVYGSPWKSRVFFYLYTMYVSRVLIDDTMREFTTTRVLNETLIMLLVIFLYRVLSTTTYCVQPYSSRFPQLNAWVEREWEVWWGVGQGQCKKFARSIFFVRLRWRIGGKKTFTYTHVYECMRRESCHGKNNLSPGYILSGSSATTMFASTTASGERP